MFWKAIRAGILKVKYSVTDFIAAHLVAVPRYM
jgi:hypothetical protein